MGLEKCLLGLLVISCLLLAFLDPTEGKKSRRKDEDSGDGNNNNNNGRPNRLTSESDRSKLFDGLQDPETSAQGINTATLQNPLANQFLLGNQGAGLYQNQAGLAGLGGGLGGFGGAGGLGGFGGAGGLGGFGGAGGLGGLGGAGGLANLGGGIFSNQQQGFNNPYLNGYQNPYLQGGLGGFGGAGGAGLGLSADIYNQGAFAAQLYNNPLYGGAGTLSGAAAGINPLLLRGAQNTQYPVVGGLGAYNNPYLAAQALLSPYSNYNQLNNYPFSSRFGIGSGTGRSGLSGRYNSQNSNSKNNDE